MSSRCGDAHVLTQVPPGNRLCHYAYASNARDTSTTSLPTISAPAPATLLKLTTFSWAAGGQPYFGRGADLSVTGYDRDESGDLVSSGVSASFFYAAAQHVGGSGASMVEVALPEEFGAFAAVVFNITSDYSVEEPFLLLDDVSGMVYTPE